MPLPPVVIELNQSDAASTNAATLVGACTTAVSDGECRLGTSSDAAARAVVLVTWSAEHRHAKVEIGVKGRERSRWVSREIDFREADPEAERWRSVGLVIGTLVPITEREAAAETGPPGTSPSGAGGAGAATPSAPKPEKTAATPPAPAPSAAPNPEPTTPTARPPAAAAARLWLGLEGVAGPALDDGSWRFGAGFVSVYDFPGVLLASGTLRYSARPSTDTDTDERWFTGALGVGLQGRPLPALRLEGRSELVVDRLDAETTGTTPDHGGRWLLGGRLSLTSGAMLAPRVMLVVGAELTGLTQGTQVRVDGNLDARVPPLTWSIVIGPRFGVF
jgi:hypothetical protein